MKNRKIAVLIDSDNTPHKVLPSILNELSAFGHIVTKRAYGDFSKEQLKHWKKPLNELAIQPRQQFAYTTGKNATDSLMIIEAMDLLYKERYDCFAIVSSDSDFTTLANRLREDQILVVGVGKQKTPSSFKNACDDFIAIEHLDSAKTNASISKDIAETLAANSVKPLHNDTELWRLLHQAWQALRSEEGWVRLGEAGAYLKRVKPDFDPRFYNLQKLSDVFEHFGDRYNTRLNPGNQLEFKLVTRAEAAVR